MIRRFITRIYPQAVVAADEKLLALMKMALAVVLDDPFTTAIGADGLLLDAFVGMIANKVFVLCHDVSLGAVLFDALDHF